MYLLGVYIGDRLARLHALRGSEATDVLHQPLQLLVINVALHNTASLQPAGENVQMGRPHVVTQISRSIMANSMSAELATACMHFHRALAHIHHALSDT